MDPRYGGSRSMDPVEDRKHAAREPDPRLPEICDNIARLLGEVPRVRDLLDLAAGAAASLLRAEQLGYQDRAGRLPDEYYEALRKRVQRMAGGTLPPHGRWISGFYFNSALMRIGACRDQLRRVLQRASRQRGGAADCFQSDELIDEAARLRHERMGLSPGRAIGFDSAVSALQDLVNAIDRQAALLRDPRTIVPDMSATPRHRRRVREAQ